MVLYYRALQYFISQSILIRITFYFFAIFCIHKCVCIRLSTVLGIPGNSENVLELLYY